MAAGMKPNWEYTYCFVGSYKTYESTPTAL